MGPCPREHAPTIKRKMLAQHLRRPLGRQRRTASTAKLSRKSKEATQHDTAWHKPKHTHRLNHFSLPPYLTPCPTLAMSYPLTPTDGMLDVRNAANIDPAEVFARLATLVMSRAAERYGRGQRERGAATLRYYLLLFRFSLTPPPTDPTRSRCSHRSSAWTSPLQPPPIAGSRRFLDRTSHRSRRDKLELAERRTRPARERSHRRAALRRSLRDPVYSWMDNNVMDKVCLTTACRFTTYSVAASWRKVSYYGSY
ncbi:hypothetical protein HYPSUDRAFT_209612 [Hypholoma sublateritium FD-334 SS-4]|uniref:Uncharacterized protein n=1 Tax=Hypholoma sublateritium (strain FD-334 SS-4) TaxID=945553 RepID=A0A0D2NY02_HYPSF|nr:hypothetical protein HYPSUDRAFT_209612 [Hypholoma sublateritium FD-334 SS-4]